MRVKESFAPRQGVGVQAAFHVVGLAQGLWQRMGMQLSSPCQTCALPRPQLYLWQMLNGIAYCHSRRCAESCLAEKHMPRRVLHTIQVQLQGAACWFCAAAATFRLLHPTQGAAPRPEATEPAGGQGAQPAQTCRLWFSTSLWHPSQGIHSRGGVN